MTEKDKKNKGTGKRKETEKTKQLTAWTENSDDQALTTSHGVKVNHNDDSLKAGERGPTLMEDFHFREKMTHFDHERIPERVVHARGAAAHGYFQVFESLSNLTMAKLFQDPSKEIPVFVRFSTVVGFRGSADTVRDVRGFATKFYTEDGNWDLVGNNMPVFFIQDGIKFPDLVHAIKPGPHNEIPQASAAHDNFWDFISLMPESMHMIMWVLSDRALPRSYSMMEGFGVHTFRFINEEGKASFVKFHWKPVNGIHSLTWDETQKIAGMDPDFNRRDLWDSIEAGNYPEFHLGVQVIPEEDEFSFDFDLLDPTKLIPEELVPVKIIGKMVLNRNPDNFFAETEQAAFHPGHVVRGIDFTNDPLLQARLFSYIDTQLTRLGGPNFNEIPINRPLAEVHNNQRDGHMRQTINKGETHYLPNSRRGGCPFTASREMGAFVHHMERVEGHKIKARSDSFRNYFSQARLFYDSQSEAGRRHIQNAFLFELGKVQSMEIRQRMVYMIANIDIELAESIAEGIGVDRPDDEKKIISVAKDARPPVKGKQSIDVSDALNQEKYRANSIKGRKIAILIEEGFDYKAVMSIAEMIRKNNALVEIISKNHGEIKSSGDEKMKTDKTYLTTSSVLYDAVFIPGGEKSIERMKNRRDVVYFIYEAYRHCKPVAATGEAIKLFSEMGIIGVELSGEITNRVVNHRGIITAAEHTMFEEFTHQFRNAIMDHRFWDREDIVATIPA